MTLLKNCSVLAMTAALVLLFILSPVAQFLFAFIGAYFVSLIVVLYLNKDLP